jgi:hypothetical protein
MKISEYLPVSNHAIFVAHLTYGCCCIWIWQEMGSKDFIICTRESSNCSCGRYHLKSVIGNILLPYWFTYDRIICVGNIDEATLWKHVMIAMCYNPDWVWREFNEN